MYCELVSSMPGNATRSCRVRRHVRLSHVVHVPRLAGAHPGCQRTVLRGSPSRGLALLTVSPALQLLCAPGARTDLQFHPIWCPNAAFSRSVPASSAGWTEYVALLERSHGAACWRAV